MAVRVFRNGHVFDGLRHQCDCAVVTLGERIVFVGSEAEARDFAGRAGAEEVDLGGGLLAPGFQDAHVHPMMGGLERLRCDLSDLSSREEYLDAVKRYAEEHPEAPWIRGGGWSLASFPGGSDWPVSSPDPVAAIHTLLNRRPPGADSSARALLPGQALTLRQAFAAYTSGSAYAGHQDDTGHLQVGARADLVVLDRDPFAGPAEEIGEARVVATYVGGEPVYTA